jgi:hypothetical protein
MEDTGTLLTKTMLSGENGSLAPKKKRENTVKYI